MPAQQDLHEAVQGPRVAGQQDVCGLITGLLRRSAAFSLDAFLLLALGSLAGALMPETLASFGAWGRGVGLLIVLLYFGLGDSALTGGRTPGRLVLGLYVSGANGLPLPVWRAAARTLVVCLPLFVETRQLSWHPATEAALASLIYGSAIAHYYLYLFNRRSRQGLHDLLTGSYVLRPTQNKAYGGMAQAWKGHFRVAFALAAISCLFIALAQGEMVRSGKRDLMARASGAVKHEPGVAVAHSMMGEVLVRREPRRFNQMVVRLYERPEGGLETRASGLVALAMEEVPEAFEVEEVGMRISYGFDIGIAVKYETVDMYLSPDKWRKLKP